MFSFFKKQDDDKGDELREAYLDADSKVDLYSDYGCNELREEAEKERDKAKSDEDNYWAEKSKWKLW